MAPVSFTIYTNLEIVRHEERRRPRTHEHQRHCPGWNYKEPRTMLTPAVKPGGQGRTGTMMKGGWRRQLWSTDWMVLICDWGYEVLQFCVCSLLDLAFHDASYVFIPNAGRGNFELSGLGWRHRNKDQVTAPPEVQLRSPSRCCCHISKHWRVFNWMFTAFVVVKPKKSSQRVHRAVMSHWHDYLYSCDCYRYFSLTGLNLSWI